MPYSSGYWLSFAVWITSTALWQALTFPTSYFSLSVRSNMLCTFSHHSSATLPETKRTKSATIYWTSQTVNNTLQRGIEINTPPLNFPHTCRRRHIYVSCDQIIIPFSLSHSCMCQTLAPKNVFRLRNPKRLPDMCVSANSTTRLHHVLNRGQFVVF